MITTCNFQSTFKFPYVLPSNLISGCETQAKLGKTLLTGVQGLIAVNSSNFFLSGRQTELGKSVEIQRVWGIWRGVQSANFFVSNDFAPRRFYFGPFCRHSLRMSDSINSAIKMQSQSDHNPLQTLLRTYSKPKSRPYSLKDLKNGKSSSIDLLMSESDSLTLKLAPRMKNLSEAKSV